MTLERSTVHFARALALLALACPALAQIAAPRTLPELKAEVQERADRKVYPVSQLDAAEVREALGALKTLDRDEWAQAWSAIGDRHMAQAKNASDRAKEVWINPQGGHMGRNVALSDQKIFETVTLPWVVRMLK